MSVLSLLNSPRCRVQGRRMASFCGNNGRSRRFVVGRLAREWTWGRLTPGRDRNTDVKEINRHWNRRGLFVCRRRFEWVWMRCTGSVCSVTWVWIYCCESACVLHDGIVLCFWKPVNLTELSGIMEPAYRPVGLATNVVC